jgi:hypothetical protein
MRDKDKRKFAWLPTAEQELLLKAGLFEDSTALDAWRQWRSRVSATEIFQA